MLGLILGTYVVTKCANNQTVAPQFIERLAFAFYPYCADKNDSVHEHIRLCQILYVNNREYAPYVGDFLTLPFTSLSLIRGDSLIIGAGILNYKIRFNELNLLVCGNNQADTSQFLRDWLPYHPYLRGYER